MGGAAHRLLDEMREGPPAAHYIALNQRFHTTLYEYSQRTQLVEMIAALRDASSAYLHIYRAAGRLPGGAPGLEHRTILAACVNRDPDAAAAAPPAGTWRTRWSTWRHDYEDHTRRQPPRPEDLIRTMFAKQEGVPVDPVALEERTRTAVAEIVAKQLEAGVDVISDGEMGKPSYVTYITDRLDGFGGTSQPLTYADLVPFPNLQRKVFGDPGRARRKTPACNGPITVRDPDAGAPRHRAPRRRQGRGDGVHERRLPRRHRALLPQRLLRHP